MIILNLIENEGMTIVHGCTDSNLQLCDNITEISTETLHNLEKAKEDYQAGSAIKCENFMTI